MVNNGDLTAIQGGVLRFQGEREVRISQQGAVRIQTFHQPVQVYEDIGSTYGPFNGVGTGGVSDCRFAIAFSDEPIIDASISLADEQYWDGESSPAIAYCVVNWLRLEGHRLFVGAHVAFKIYGGASGQKFISHFTFSGPAVATPLNGATETENTTDGPDWEVMGEARDPEDQISL